nr:M48 family metallopeptidase [Pseudoroseicyclus aestuarii]
MRLLPTLCVCLALAACGSVTVMPPAPGPAPQAQPQSIGTGAPEGLDRDKARMFVEVVDRVEPVAEAFCRVNAAPGTDCDLRIVVDDRPGIPANAFQTRDAFGRPVIAFTLALLDDVDNADEMAFILSHEASHHIAGHLDRQNEAAAVGADVFVRLAGTFGQTSPEAVAAAQQLGAAVGARSYSQDFELEADTMGTAIAARAGYDPLRGADFFLRIPDPGNRFLGTHPPNGARREAVRRAAAQAGY